MKIWCAVSYISGYFCMEMSATVMPAQDPFKCSSENIQTHSPIHLDTLLYKECTKIHRCSADNTDFVYVSITRGQCVQGSYLHTIIHVPDGEKQHILKVPVTVFSNPPGHV